MSYLALASYKPLSALPYAWIDEEETRDPGWIDAQAEFWSRRLDARLAKRYATPFSEVAGESPTVVRGWLATILDVRVMIKRGVNPQDEQFLEYQRAAAEAWAEVKEAADAKDGLFELPLKQTAPGANGVSRGAPLGYSEGTPYEWSYNQRQRAIDEGNG